MAATGVKLGADKILLFGGARGDVLLRREQEYPRKIEQAKAAGNQALVEQLTKEMDALYDDHQGFSRDVLSYDVVNDRWATVAEMPTTGPVTTTAAAWGESIVIPSGEKSPGIRTRDVWQATPFTHAAEVTVGGVALNVARLPPMMKHHRRLGIVAAEPLRGQVVHRAQQQLFETRATVTPEGDFLLMFPEGRHYASGAGKINSLVAYRSSDRGQTWTGPTVALDIDYSQHGFIPFLPRGSQRIYAFGTQPIPSQYSREHGKHENTPIGFRYSDDDGRSWSDVQLIRPQNDPEFLGMSVMRMCETDSGAWLIGSHAADWSTQPLTTRQYVLRSEDQGKTWTLLPGKRPHGWFADGFGRMDEGRPINLGGGEVLLMARTPEGHLWTARSTDDGATWSDPEPSKLIHPDAPPMLFHLSDGKTLVAFHHNRHSGVHFRSEDRSEIWASTSSDGGRTWSEPRFVFANALAANPDKKAWYNHQSSYLDAFAADGKLHIFCPHRWQQVLHLELPETALESLPTKGQL